MLHRWEKSNLLTLDSFKPYLILSSVDTLISAAASLEYGSLTLGKEDVGRLWVVLDLRYEIHLYLMENVFMTLSRLHFLHNY